MGTRGQSYLGSPPATAAQEQSFQVSASGLTDHTGNVSAVVWVRGRNDQKPGHRTMYIGDELPQGNIVDITGEGIVVLPDEGGEILLPVGSGPRRDYSVEARRSAQLGHGGSSGVDLTEDEADALIDERAGPGGPSTQPTGPGGGGPTAPPPGVDPEDPFGIFDDDDPNEEIYKDGVTPEARMDMAQADLNLRVNDKKKMGTRSHQFGPERGVTRHSLLGQDGVTRTFLESDDGRVYNTTYRGGKW